MSSRVFLLFSLTTLLLLSVVSPSFSISDDVDDEDLSFLEDPQDEAPAESFTTTATPLDELKLVGGEEEEEETEVYEEEEQGNPFSNPFPTPGIDEKDVVVIKESNFADVIANNKHVMVEFYAPWCGHCQLLAPEYAAAATELKEDSVVLAKIDGTEEKKLAQMHSVQGFPTILFFVDGEHKPYNGGRTKENIVTWVKKKIGHSVYNLTTIDEAEKVLASGNKVVLGYLNS